MLCWRCLLVSLGALSSAVLFAQDRVQTGRYSAVAAVATPVQQAPLEAIISVEFSERVNTVGMAVQTLMIGTGYDLSDILYWDVEVLELFERPLPEAHRHLGPLSVLTALKTVIGPAFYLIIDPVHRLVGFKVHPDVESLGFGSGEMSEEAVNWKHSF